MTKYQKNNYATKTEHENLHEKIKVEFALHFSYFCIIYYILLYLTVT